MSGLRIVPPVTRLFPGQRQLFAAESEPPPAMWRNVQNSGDIKSDFSLEVDPAGSQTEAFGAHRLVSGIGFVEWTIDDQCLPVSAGVLVFAGRITDTNLLFYDYRVEITATQIQIKDEALSTLTTISYSTVSGDKYRLEFAAGFRLSRNGAFLHQRVSLPSTVVYPVEYYAIIIEDVDTPPARIPPPHLVGKWQVSPSVNWTAPSHGSLTTTGLSDSTEYFGGTIPGTYTLTGQIEPSADATNAQRATATIIIEPLENLGSPVVVLKPGQKARFKVNYPDGLITWSAVTGDGTFTQNEYTAALESGVSIVRASASGQAVNITVIVLPEITNLNGYLAAKPSEQIDFNINIPVMPQFVSGGGVVAGTGNVTPPLPALELDDIMLLYVETANQTVSTPSGWNIVSPDSPQGTGTGGDAAATRLSVFWRRATATESAPTITDPGDHVIARIHAFRHCINSGNPWDVTSGDVAAAATTAVSVPGDTTTVPNCLIVLIVSNGTDSLTPQTSGFTNADLANLAELVDDQTDVGNGGGFAVAIGEKANQSAYGATTATLANASTQGRMSIALKPPGFTWSASAGSINSSSGLWTAPSLAGQTARITVTDGTRTVTLDIPVLNVFPITRFATPMDGARSKKVVIGEAEDGTDFSRVKANARDSYPLQLKLLTLTEYQSIQEFWDDHHPGKPFIMEDVPRQKRMVVKFDSDLAWRTLAGRFEVSFRVKEVAGF